MPAWFAALDAALCYLDSEQGLLGVCDFCVSAKHDLPPRQQGWARRFFWRALFDLDGVDCGAGPPRPPGPREGPATGGGGRLMHLCRCARGCSRTRAATRACTAALTPPGPERRQYLDHRLRRVWEVNAAGTIPYVPLLKAPFYCAIWRAGGGSGDQEASAGPCPALLQLLPAAAAPV